jgi:hypothetical protein
VNHRRKRSRRNPKQAHRDYVPKRNLGNDASRHRHSYHRQPAMLADEAPATSWNRLSDLEPVLADRIAASLDEFRPPMSPEWMTAPESTPFPVEPPDPPCDHGADNGTSP